MYKMNRRSILKASAASVAAVSIPKVSNAQPASYTPDDLKGTLTPFGALRAGNADGTIPAWTGGYSTVPAGYKQGDVRPIPFADEKPLYSITSAGLSQYQGKLTPGALALFAKHPDYHMNVYPTHRTAIAPQYIYDNTYKNASTAQLAPDGNSISGAYGGLPFPIPKNGHEVIWNHALSWAGTSIHLISDAYTITADGNVVFDARTKAFFQWPYYFENGESRFTGYYVYEYIMPIAPPYEAGAGILLYNNPLNPYATPVQGWEYLEGERRVRRAPELQYDTPNSLVGGVTNWDEAFMFSGKLDEYDFQLIGTKEVYLPYNANKVWSASVAEQFGPKFINADLMRWELHRVRVVEMTLKPGSRNVDARRTVYADEDTGAIMLVDIYDASGSLWKFMHNLAVILPDIPCLLANSSFVTYDLHAGNYAVGNIPNSDTGVLYEVVPEIPKSFFTPGQLAASAGGF